MDHGTPEQIKAMTDSRSDDSDSKKIGVRMVYEQVQSDREKKALQEQSGANTMQLQRENLRLINKDFRIVKVPGCRPQTTGTIVR
jgi:hypothetical protein